MNEIERMADRLWDSWEPAIPDKSPHTEVAEDGGNVVVKTELPGFRKKDVDITLDGDILTLKAERKQEQTGDDMNKTYVKRYIHSTKLPFKVDGDRANATFSRGHLELSVPKSEEIKAKRIEIKSPVPKNGTGKRTRKAKRPAKQ
jgi:HSP20 family protein